MISKTAGVALALLLGATSAAFAAGLTNSTDTPPPPSAQGMPHHAVRNSHRTESRGLYMYAPSGVEQNQAIPGGTERGQAATPAGESSRDAALKDCSAKANKWSSSSWQTTQLAVYGACMTQHGQQG